MIMQHRTLQITLAQDASTSIALASLWLTVLGLTCTLCAWQTASGQETGASPSARDLFSHASPGSQHTAFETTLNAKRGIYIVRADGSDLRPLTASP